MEQRSRRLTDAFVAALERHPELADVFGLKRIPDESALSWTWRNRFDDDGYITANAYHWVKEIYNEDLSVPEARPLKEVKQSSEGPSDPSEDAIGFYNREIYRTTRLARRHGFDPFDSGRAQNATYEDTRFFELQTFIGMDGCGTPQGAARFQFRQGKKYGPHGDTHLRTVKQFNPENLIDEFQQATDRLLSVIESESSFRRPVTIAIDITTVRYYPPVTNREGKARQVLRSEESAIRRGNERKRILNEQDLSIGVQQFIGGQPGRLCQISNERLGIRCLDFEDRQ